MYLRPGQWQVPQNQAGHVPETGAEINVPETSNEVEGCKVKRVPETTIEVKGCKVSRVPEKIVKL